MKLDNYAMLGCMFVTYTDICKHSMFTVQSDHHGTSIRFQFHVRLKPLWYKRGLRCGAFYYPFPDQQPPTHTLYLMNNRKTFLRPWVRTAKQVEFFLKKCVKMRKEAGVWVEVCGWQLHGNVGIVSRANIAFCGWDTWPLDFFAFKLFVRHTLCTKLLTN